MLQEIQATTEFILHYFSGFPEESLHLFRDTLVTLLAAKYAGHWDPFQPYYGNAYRSIDIISGRIDRLLLTAAQAAGLSSTQLESTFPQDMVIWVDPGCVSYRVGDYGYITPIYQDYAHQDHQQYQQRPYNGSSSPYQSYQQTQHQAASAASRNVAYDDTRKEVLVIS